MDEEGLYELNIERIKTNLKHIEAQLILMRSSSITASANQTTSIKQQAPASVRGGALKQTYKLTLL